MSTYRFSENVMNNAGKILSECMGCEDSFCKSRCPMSTDVKGYVNRIAERDYEGALKIILDTLFLPGTLGRICAHPCENLCRREQEYQQPISIAKLKAFAADHADREKLQDLYVGEPTGKRVAVIGGGPAGAQAAIDLRKAGHEVTIYEKRPKRGGVLQYGIPRYRLSRSVLDAEFTYLDRLGVITKTNTEVGKDISFAALREQYDAVLIAVGAQKGSIVKVPGWESEGVCTALDFLREVNTTGRYQGFGKRIFIVGGGDVAMDSARSALRLGAEVVYQCSLETLAQLPASKAELEGALEEGIQCNFGWGPDCIEAKNGRVCSIRVKNVEELTDSTGRFNPSYGDERMQFEVDTIIMATGQGVADVTDGALKQGGGGRYIVDSKTLATDLPDVFAAGDAAGGRIAVEAMALGRKAAISINRYLVGQDLCEGRDFEKEWSYETKLYDVPLPEDAEDLPRISSQSRPVEERIRDFLPVDRGFTEEEAVQEASRCFQCECRRCVKTCTMLQTFEQCPKEFCIPLTTEGRVNLMQIYSCNDCGECALVCPHDLPIREVLMEARYDITRAHHGESPLAGHRAIRIHQEQGFSSAFTTKVSGGVSDDI